MVGEAAPVGQIITARAERPNMHLKASGAEKRAAREATGRLTPTEVREQVKREDTSTAEGALLDRIKTNITADRGRQESFDGSVAHKKDADASAASLSKIAKGKATEGRAELTARGITLDQAAEQIAQGATLQPEINTKKRELKAGRGAKSNMPLEASEGVQVERIHTFRETEARAGEAALQALLPEGRRLADLSADEIANLPDLTDVQRRQLHAHHTVLQGARGERHMAVIKLAKLNAQRLANPASATIPTYETLDAEQQAGLQTAYEQLAEDLHTPDLAAIRTQGAGAVDGYIQRFNLSDADAAGFRQALGIQENATPANGEAPYTVTPDQPYDRLLMADAAYQRVNRDFVAAMESAKTDPLHFADTAYNLALIRQIARDELARARKGITALPVIADALREKRAIAADLAAQRAQLAEQQRRDDRWTRAKARLAHGTTTQAGRLLSWAARHLKGMETGVNAKAATRATGRSEALTGTTGDAGAPPTVGLNAELEGAVDEVRRMEDLVNLSAPLATPAAPAATQ